MRISRRVFVQTAISAAALAQSTALRAMNADTPGPIPVPLQEPAKSGIAAVAGTRLSYWDTGGTGEAIVLLHPATGSERIWSYQQPVFAKAGYRVIAYSRRGYGGSDSVPKENPGTAAGDLQALMDFLKVRKFHAIGSAAGGGIAVDYALSHPERLASLIVACAVGGVEDRDYAQRIEALRPNGFDAMPAVFRELSPAYRAANPEGAAQWAALERAAVTGNRLGQKPANTVTWARLSGLNVPALIIGGDADLYVPPPLIRTYAAHIPGAELVIVPEAGHSVYWERPDVFNRAVLDFLARHRG